MKRFSRRYTDRESEKILLYSFIPKKNIDDGKTGFMHHKVREVITRMPFG